jgi:hypothetical protein
MNRSGRWARTIGLCAIVLLLAIPAISSASTTVRTFTASPYFDHQSAAPAAPPVTIGAHAVVRLGRAPAYAAAGVQGTSPGLQGTGVVLASCALGTCIANYRPASAPALPARHYTERVTFTVTQPSRVGTAVGFDVDVGVDLATGWVFGRGYFSTGVDTHATTSTVTLRLFVDLGAAVPTVNAVQVTVNLCTSATGCP